MKTTIELPDHLLQQAKQRALDQGTTLRALIESGLRHTLTQAPAAPEDRPAYRIPVIRNGLQLPAGGESHTCTEAYTEAHTEAYTEAHTDANALIDAVRDEGLRAVTPDDPAP